MCGIAGVARAGGRAVEPSEVRSMVRTMAHRGPDGEGCWSSGAVGLGHRRLAVLDLSRAARQPMTSGDGKVVLVYNGEVYNFRELRRELQELGYSFRSTGDAEVVLNAVHAWGRDCIGRFNGMFAFAAWDGRSGTLLLARDRYGIKPLYYLKKGRTLLFASEIKAILRHGEATPAVSPAALLEYFTFQNIFTDLTLFDGVRMLPAGHCAVVDPGSDPEPALERYWDFDFTEETGGATDRELEEELFGLFTRAVRRQLVSDVPVGSYLSGGIDSGAITAVASGEVPYITTFTGGFDLSSASGLELGADERAKAEALSYRFRTEHYEVVMKAGDMERVMPRLIWHLEDLRVGQCYPNYYVARLAGRFVKVVLSGTGGDELFAGYPWRYFCAGAGGSFDEYAEHYYGTWQRLVRNKVLQRLFQPDLWEQMRDVMTVDIFRGILARSGAAPVSPEDYINLSLYLESKTFLQGLLVVEDKLSMAHGLETRVPFLDNDLVDFAMKLPVRTKLREMRAVERIDENRPGPKGDRYFAKTNDGKLILRSVLGRFMPGGYADGVKQGFSAPDASWFRGDSIEYVREIILDPGARIYRFLRPDTVRDLVEEHLRGERNRRLLIWSLLSFEWWCRIFLEGERPP